MLLVFMLLLLGMPLTPVKRLLCTLLMYSLVLLRPLRRLIKHQILFPRKYMPPLLGMPLTLTPRLLGMRLIIPPQISVIYRRLNKNLKITSKNTILLTFGLVLVLLVILLMRCGMVPWVLIGIMALAVVTELLLTDQK